MIRVWVAGALTLIILAESLQADENPLLMRGGVEGQAFSEVGRLYVDDDELVHFRTDQRLYFFSHMYYIWDALQVAGVTKDGRIIYDKPLRITGNYSKAKYVYNFLEEPALRGSQIMWIDQVARVEELSDEEMQSASLFDGESLSGWSTVPAESKTSIWKVENNFLSGSALPNGPTQLLISDRDYIDFELVFEYRASWQTSASILLRANERGEGIALSLDHVDEGIVGFPKSVAGAFRPFKLYQAREERGVGADAHFHIQYDGRVNEHAVARDKLVQSCTLGDFLNAWDGGYWNLVKIRCVGQEPEITFWINGLQVSQFNAKTVPISQELPASMGAIEKYAVHPSGHIGFALHFTPHEEPEFLIREVRVRRLK